MIGFLKRKAVVSGLALAVGLGIGWQAKGWLEDSKRLSAMEAAQAAIDSAMEREATIARKMEDRLAELEASERVIDRGIIREVERPVYKRVCLEPDAIRLLNAAAEGRSPDDSGELTEEVSDDTADDNGRDGSGRGADDE